MERGREAGGLKRVSGWEGTDGPIKRRTDRVE